jgi:hypothetical protein
VLKLEQQFGLYVILEPLKTGRNRASVRAEDPFFARDVTLKLIGPGAIGGKENLSSLEKQLEALSGLENPAIAPIYDCGTETGYCYFTTTYFPAGNLAEQLTESCPPERALRILLQITQGLAYAYGEGFEHGKLSLKDIFLTAEGQAQIGDFGLNASLRNLNKTARQQKNNPAANDLTHDTLLSLGEILIKLLLGAGAKPDKVSLALLEQTQHQPLAALAADLIGKSEHPVTSFQQLVERLQNLVAPDQTEDFGEIKQAAGILPPDSLTKPEISSGSQRQREIKEAVYARTEIRRLVEEKCKLQEKLRRAVYYKKITDEKISGHHQALIAARKDVEKARLEADEAWRIAAARRPLQRPVIWAAGGVLAGILLSGGFGYFQYGWQAPPQQLTQVESALPAAPAPHKTTEKQPESISEIRHQATVELPVADLPELQLENSWWPLGGEFNPGMVVSTARAEAADLAETINQNLAQSPVKPAKLAQVSSTAPAAVAAATSSYWWPAGSEFNQQAAVPLKSLNTAAAVAEHEKVLALVKSWATAWSNQDLEQYFSCYSTDYRPEPGYSRSQWRDSRRSRLERPAWIQVGYDDLRLNFVSENHVQIKLKQTYQSDFYQDQIRKSLNLIKEDGQWRIVMERSLGPVNG